MKKPFLIRDSRGRFRRVSLAIPTWRHSLQSDAEARDLFFSAAALVRRTEEYVSALSGGSK